MTRTRLVAALAGALVWTAALRADAVTCCLNRSCVDLPRATCESGRGTLGYCVVGQPCGAACSWPSSSGGVTDITGVKVGVDVQLRWSPASNADRYDVIYVLDKHNIHVPCSTCSLPLPIDAPSATTVPEVVHAGAAPRLGPAPVEVYYYDVSSRCGARACCDAGGSCTETTEDACLVAGGAFDQSSNCWSMACSTAGSCCMGTTCSDLTASECAAQAGRFYAGTCGRNPCQVQVVVGACCGPRSWPCSEVTQSYCASRGGIYQGDGTPCWPYTCAGPGACCEASGGCSQQTLAACLLGGGVHQETGSSCAASECGACCSPNGECIPTARSDCSGTYQGSGTSCLTTACGPIGACCLASGACQETNPFTCTGMGGVWHPDTCATRDCKVTGACCASGGCSEVTEAACPYYYRGDLTTCTPDPCSTFACCTFGGCIDLTEAACRARGCGGTLSPLICSSSFPPVCDIPVPTGPCCLAGNCSLQTPRDCGTLGGTFHHDWCSCTPSPC